METDQLRLEQDSIYLESVNQNNTMPFSVETNETETWALLAAAGGVARFLSTRIAPEAEPITKAKFAFLMIANILVSGFSGLMGALVASAMTEDATWHFVSAGVFGFLGAKGIEILSDKLNSKLV
jgi:hypothetical protein